jgi:hypothetical protein
MDETKRPHFRDPYYVHQVKVHIVKQMLQGVHQVKVHILKQMSQGALKPVQQCPSQ